MGSWDELCLICGLRPGGGPRMLYGDLWACLNMIIHSLEEQKLDLTLSKEELVEHIRKILLLFGDGKYYRPTSYETAIAGGSISPGPYFPFTYEYKSWNGWSAIAVGIFDKDFNGGAENAKGMAVTTRLVTHWTEWGGIFGGIEGSNGTEAVTTHASAGDDAFFCLRGPYSYLQSWIDRDSLPPRQTTFPLEPDMSFEGEFYEIVNYRAKRGYLIGTLDRIDYEGIDLALDQWQDTFWRTFSGAYELGRALKGGLRGNDLIPALLHDFCVWQTCPPDRWVSTDSPFHHSTKIQVSQSVTSTGHWQNIPAEIVIEILSNLSVKEVLYFASSCRQFHHRFGGCDFLAILLRAQFRLPLSGSYWFLPVPNVEGEVEKFCKACNGSKSGKPNVLLPKSSDVSVILDPEFPIVDFFRANYSSDSMRNRRRLWRISQQFRREWYRYRTEGYDDGNDYEELNDDDNAEKNYTYG
ncbi:hypothetical protein CPB86DRAFT_878641 [Serendipita vermifera]|nr:hypothetical protein CPB86DRAFT_878641 [Serendipita vermifera]